MPAKQRNGIAHKLRRFSKTFLILSISVALAKAVLRYLPFYNIMIMASKAAPVLNIIRKGSYI